MNTIRQTSLASHRAAALRADLKDQEQATFIGLDDEDTRAGVLTLEAVGLIAAGREAQIEWGYASLVERGNLVIAGVQQQSDETMHPQLADRLHEHSQL